MRFCIVILYLIALTRGVVYCAEEAVEPNSQLLVIRRAEEMVAKFELGNLRPGFNIYGVRADELGKAGPTIVNGPTIRVEPLGELRKGTLDGMIHLNRVSLNGEDLAALGAPVFPIALRLLDHSYGYMRWIGAEALAKLTGSRQTWRYNEAPWNENGQEARWASESKLRWVKWYSSWLSDQAE